MNPPLFTNHNMSDDHITSKAASPHVVVGEKQQDDDAKELACLGKRQPSPPTTRKRSLARRYGQSHTTLIRAAALAAMSSPNGEDSSDDTNAEPDVTSLLRTAPPMPEFSFDYPERYSRKRMRGSNNSAILVEQTASFLDSLRVTDSGLLADDNEEGEETEDVLVEDRHEKRPYLHARIDDSMTSQPAKHFRMG